VPLPGEPLFKILYIAYNFPCGIFFSIYILLHIFPHRIRKYFARKIVRKSTKAQMDFFGKSFSLRFVYIKLCKCLPMRIKSGDQTIRIRVTRLGEFSPRGHLFTFGSFLKIADVAQYSAYFFHRTNYLLILTKNGLYYIFGQFFTNSTVKYWPNCNTTNFLSKLIHNFVPWKKVGQTFLLLL
jgi:hypothetical protein